MDKTDIFSTMNTYDSDSSNMILSKRQVLEKIFSMTEAFAKHMDNTMITSRKIYQFQIHRDLFLRSYPLINSNQI